MKPLHEGRKHNSVFNVTFENVFEMSNAGVKKNWGFREDKSHFVITSTSLQLTFFWFFPYQALKYSPNFPSLQTKNSSTSYFSNHCPTLQSNFQKSYFLVTPVLASLFVLISPPINYFAKWHSSHFIWLVSTFCYFFDIWISMYDCFLNLLFKSISNLIHLNPNCKSSASNLRRVFSERLTIHSVAWTRNLGFILNIFYSFSHPHPVFFHCRLIIYTF